MIYFPTSALSDVPALLISHHVDDRLGGRPDVVYTSSPKGALVKDGLARHSPATVFVSGRHAWKKVRMVLMAD